MATYQDNQTQRIPHIREEGGRYVLHPEDNDLFVHTGRQIIAGCRLGISLQVWFKECKSMYDHVQKWSGDRSAEIHCCYATPRGVGIGLFFVPNRETFNFDLADELAELSAELVRSFNVGPVEIHQVPADEVNRFVVPDTATRIYSHAEKPHQAVGT